MSLFLALILLPSHTCIVISVEHHYAQGHGKVTAHKPEVILNNFTTRLGHTVARMLASLFPQEPQFQGRRAVTFHNQRDFVFIRHHRRGEGRGGGMVAAFSTM